MNNLRSLGGVYGVNNLSRDHLWVRSFFQCGLIYTANRKAL
jgi:hypothetical protein